MFWSLKKNTKEQDSLRGVSAWKTIWDFHLLEESY